MKIMWMIRGQRRWLGRAVCVSLLFLAQNALAEIVSFGGAYSRFDELLIVATGADDAQNCANLNAAIAAVSGVGTIKLPPATYDCGLIELVVPSGVTLEGSGQPTTNIIGQGTGSGNNGIVLVQNGAALYNLTVQNTAAGGSSAIAVRTAEGSSLTHVTVISSGTNTNNQGVKKSSGLEGSQPINLKQVTIRASGGSSFSEGIFSESASTFALEGVNIVATGSPTSCGIYSENELLTLTIRNSVVNGAGAAINWDEGGTVEGNIAHSQLVNGASGTLLCFSVHDGNFAALDASCVLAPL